MSDFDFDYWMELYQSDPEEAARQRKEQLYRMIEDKFGVDTPKSNRLKGVLWIVWQRTHKNKNPYMRMEIAATAMWEEFHKLNAKLKEVSNHDRD